MFKKLTVVASMSGGGKSTFAKNNFPEDLVFPDTNVGIYDLYWKLFRTPALENNVEPDKLTGLTLWSAKYSADMEFLKGRSNVAEILDHFKIPPPQEYLNMRSGWDFLIFDENWQKRKIIPEDEMYKFVRNIESQFEEVEYKIWHMRDEKIIEELMARNDDRSTLFNNDPKVYHEWQDHFVNRYVEIMEKYNYKYELKEVSYT